MESSQLTIGNKRQKEPQMDSLSIYLASTQLADGTEFEQSGLSATHTLWPFSVSKSLGQFLGQYQAICKHADRQTIGDLLLLLLSLLSLLWRDVTLTTCQLAYKCAILNHLFVCFSFCLSVSLSVSLSFVQCETD